MIYSETEMTLETFADHSTLYQATRNSSLVGHGQLRDLLMPPEYDWWTATVLEGGDVTKAAVDALRSIADIHGASWFAGQAALMLAEASLRQVLSDQLVYSSASRLAVQSTLF